MIFEDRDARSEAAGIWPKVNWALAAGLVTCLTLLIVQPYLRDAEKVENLTRERAELTQQLVELRTKVNEKSEGIGAADRIARALDDRVPRVDILRELTVRLRDDAWLSDVEISEDLLRFSGFTKGSAADLVIDLASSPHFFNPRLTGQVSIAPGTGAERYEISLDLTGESE
ncbi:MAG: PilN domain-containing protein [Pseudomonadota bacterium]